MIGEPEPHNPYQAPVALLSGERPAQKRFRWQVIPATLFGLIGGLTLMEARGFFEITGSLQILTETGLGGVLWCAASVLWIKSRWWVATAMTGLAILYSWIPTLTIGIR